MNAILFAIAALWALLFIPWARRETLVPVIADESPFSPAINFCVCALIGLIALVWAYHYLRRPVNSFLPPGTRQSLAYSSALAWLSGALLTLSRCFLLPQSSPLLTLGLGLAFSAVFAWFTPRRLARATELPAWPSLASAGLFLFMLIPTASCLHLFFQKKKLPTALPENIIQRLHAQNLVAIGVIILTTFVLARLWFRFRRLQPFARTLFIFSLILVIANLAVITTWRYQTLVSRASRISDAEPRSPERSVEMMVRPREK